MRKEIPFRVGLGVDSHAFSRQKTRKLILGGIHFKNEKGLEGDSDADVVFHALFNAIHSALGKGGVGSYFKKEDFATNSNSETILKKAIETVNDSSYTIGNISITLECMKPKIEPRVGAMRENIARVSRIKVDCVGITATSGDHLTSFGKGEGIYCQCVVLLYLNQK